VGDWVEVAAVDDLPPGAFVSASLDGAEVAVFNVDGVYHAIEDICTHDGGILTGGAIEGEQIVCPRHGARFSIVTGEALTPPAYEPVQKFPVRVEDGKIQVKDPRW
jgi:3-phenylpropionate/trans-cinnamate dioxygenase ferredoxin component